jgi:hypothetical protein
MHPVELKLRSQICPYLVTVNRLWRWKPFWVYLAYVYFGEIFLLLAGFGIANPVMTFLTAGQGAGGQAKKPADDAAQGTVVEFLGSSTAGVIGLVFLVLWGLLKFYVQKEDLEKRCSLLRSCRLQGAQLANRMRHALPNPDPMPALIDIQEKLEDLIDRNVIERAYPYDGWEPGIDSLIKAYCDNLVAFYSGYWQPAPIAQRSGTPVVPGPTPAGH